MPNIKLKGQTGEVLTYEDVERVYFDSADKDGEVVYYTHGQAVSKTVTPNFASGDMNVPIADGELVTELTIEKPDTLLPENIRSGVTVAGVKGDLIGDTEEVTVDLDMAEGGQVITPSAPTKVLSKVVVTKPGTMLPENIKAGIDIGGVVGEFSGDTEEVTVDLDFSEGDQVIEPTAEGKSIVKATITKPETLVPENVAKSVDIGGVVGEYVTPGTTKEIEPYFKDCLVIDNPEDVSALLSDRGNIGKFVKYVGETGDYAAGQHYKVVDEYEAFDPESCPATAVEVTSDTTLTATLEGCKVGDLVVAAFVIRSDLVSLSDGWTLISTSQDVTEINSTAPNNQTLSFAYKYAESTTEELTVTQTTAARIYINVVALSGASGFTDAGYQYQDNSTASDTQNMVAVRPESRLVLWGATAIYWSATTWKISNDATLIQSTSSTAPRLLLAIDTSEDESVTFTPASNNSADAYICGALSVELEPSTHLVEVESTEVLIADAQTVTAEGDERWDEVVVKKPETLVPENIAKDVEISGVVGTFAGGGEDIGTGAYNIKVIDYDGTVLAEKNLDKGEVFELPNPPIHEGLVFDGWVSNVTITDNTITVLEGDITIGPMYYTKSGATEIDIVLTAATNKTMTFASILTGMTSIDWGDGTTDSTLTHTYSAYGKYTIKIYGMTAIASGSQSNGGITSGQIKLDAIVAVRLASGVTSIGQYAFYNCYSLASITFPSGVTYIGSYAFYKCYRLNNVTLPNGITAINASNFYNCYSLTNITIPSGVTTFGADVFYGCYGLVSIRFPRDLTTLGARTCYNCYGFMKADFTACENVPSVSSAGFNNVRIIYKIIAPSSMYSEWKASSWNVTYSNYLVSA